MSEKVRCAVILVVLLAAACAESSGQPIVSDTLVENSPPGRTTPAWRLSEQPTLAIGREGDARYEFHMAGNPASLSDGRIAVPNAQQEIRIYDARGQYVKSIGRSGRGPGEFQQLWSVVVLPGDSIAGLNFSSGPPYSQVFVFDTAGQLARTIALEVSEVLLPAPNGGWIGDRSRRPGQFTNVPTLVSSARYVVRFTPAGAIHDTLATLPGHSVYGTVRSYDTAPLRARGSFTIAGGALVTTAGDVHVVHQRALDDGRVLRTIRTAAPARRVTRAMIEALQPPPPPRPPVARERAARPRTDPPPYPETLPAIASMIGDASGNLWVRRYYLPTATEHEWWIYDPRGLLIATMRTPARFRITEIGRDHVLGVWRDESDVQTVRRYTLLR